MLCNFLLPWALYKLSVSHFGETRAIVISAVVPAVWGLVEFAWNRKIDAMSIAVLGGIGLSLVAVALGGSPKTLLFRESLITGLAGLVLVVSALFRRPLLYVVIAPMVRALTSAQSLAGAVVPARVLARAHEELEAFSGKPWFRRVMTTMTLVTGLIFISETAARSALIFTQPTEKVLLLAPFIQYAAAAFLLLWTFFYLMPAIRRGRAEE